MNNEISIEDMFEVVDEPEHSKAVLIDLQNKYGMSTTDFLRFYKEGIYPFPDKIVDKWLFHLKVFLLAEGDLGELSAEFKILERDSCGDTFDFDDPSLWKPTSQGQPINLKEEVIQTSSFYSSAYSSAE